MMLKSDQYINIRLFRIKLIKAKFLLVEILTKEIHG